jgi:hypothetical protein
VPIGAKHATLATGRDTRLDLFDRRLVVFSENFRARVHAQIYAYFLGAHASGVLVSAFRRNNLSKFVIARRDHQHVKRVRSPDKRLVAITRQRFTSAALVVGEVQRTALIASKATVRIGSLIAAASSFFVLVGRRA